MPVSTQFASTFQLTASDGCRLAGSRRGSDDHQPAVVLAHPIGFDRRFWNDTALQLEGAHSLILPDARGHGTSGRGNGETSIERMAIDIVEIMDALGIAQAGFVGCSMGSAVGMHLASVHGERFDWFVLANAPARIPLAREVFEAGIRAARNGGYAELARGMLARWVIPDTATRRPQWYALLEAMMLDTDPDGFADAFAALRDSDRNEDLRAIRSRVSVVTGSSDHAFPSEAASELATRMQGAKFSVVPDAAHLVPVEQPEAFARIVRKIANRAVW